MSSIDTIFFDIGTLKAEFNKKVDIKEIFHNIQKKYSLNEITKYALVCYYKWKWNLVLISFTNEKIFINSNKDLPINGVYSYQEIKGFKFLPNGKNNSFLLQTKKNTYELKHISKQIYKEFVEIFEQEKTIFINSKIGQNIMQSYSNFNTLDISKLENNFTNYESLVKEKENTFSSNDEDVVEKQQQSSKKNKRVINDECISENTTFSSAYIMDLLSFPNKTLPNDNKTVLKNFDERLYEVENSNIFSKPFDSISLKFSSNSKLNTIPVLAEFSSLNNPNKIENRLLFSRNWIEFTKHNVKNKLLGVDQNGNGTYIDLNTTVKNNIIKSYKAKQYSINNNERYGLRSSQIISFYDSNGNIGIESMYVNPITNEKLDIQKYDGIIFLNQKYYFNIPNEFEIVKEKQCIINANHYFGFHKIRIQLIIENEKIKYYVYDKNNKVFDDMTTESSLFDLKWLTFFKD